MRIATVLAFVLVASVPQVGGAQPSNEKATAEALFQEGRRLLAEGKFADACPKFSASQKLDPGLGTQLNLADCYEKLGLTASAWAEFRDAAMMARTSGAKEREQVARDRASALEPKLSRITITLPAPQAKDLKVKRDGAVVDAATLAMAVPIDPGKHVLEVSGSGKKAWSNEVDIKPGQQMTLSVPPLEDESGAKAESAPSTPPTTATTTPRQDWNTGRTAAVVTGLVGVAGLAVGGIFALKANGNLSDAKSQCASYPTQCSAGAVAPTDDAKSSATIATVATIVGAAGLAAGVVLWFTNSPAGDNRASSARVTLGIGPTGLLAQGAF